MVFFIQENTMFEQTERFELRDYQEKCVQAALDMARGHRQTRTMVNAPTGSGKTYIEVGIIRERVREGRRCLILANSQEQLYQTAKALRRAGLNFSIEYGQETASDSADKIILSTVQTMRSRLDRYAPDRFDDIIVDECHHSTAPSHRRVLAHFGALPPKSRTFDPHQYERTSLFGVTATPGKTTISQDLVDNCFTDGVCADFSTRAAMESGILCPAEGKIKNVGRILDLSDVEQDARMRNLDDFDGTLVAGKISHLTKFIAADVLEEGKNRKSIVFAPSVEFARDLAREMRKQSGSRKIVELYGDTPDREREEILRKFNKAKADSSYFLVNYAVATEGFDSPSANTIYNLRPTKLPDLLTQMLGRGLRTDPENPNKVCRLIGLDWSGDEVCQSSLILSPNALLNDKVTQEMRGGRFVNLLESIERNERKFLEDNEDSYTVELAEALKIAGTKERGSRFRKASLADLRIIADAGIDVSKEMSWHTARDLAKEIRDRDARNLATIRQIDCLRNSGQYYYRDLWEISYREAEKRIEDEKFPTARVRQLLERYGIKGLRPAIAYEIVDAIKANKMELPQKYAKYVNSKPNRTMKVILKKTRAEIVNVRENTREKTRKAIIIRKGNCLTGSSADSPDPRMVKALPENPAVRDLQDR